MNFRFSAVCFSSDCSFRAMYLGLSLCIISGGMDVRTYLRQSTRIKSFVTLGSLGRNETALSNHFVFISISVTQSLARNPTLIIEE